LLHQLRHRLRRTLPLRRASPGRDRGEQVITTTRPKATRMTVREHIAKAGGPCPVARHRDAVTRPRSRADERCTRSPCSSASSGPPSPPPYTPPTHPPSTPSTHGPTNTTTTTPNQARSTTDSSANESKKTRDGNEPHHRHHLHSFCRTTRLDGRRFLRDRRP